MEEIEERENLGLVGDCLRATWSADNHDSLGGGMTRSMLHLSGEEKAALMRVRLARGAAFVPPPSRRA